VTLFLKARFVITQEARKTMVDKAPDVNTETPKQEAPIVEDKPTEKSEVEEELDARINRIAQSREDRVRTEYTKQVKSLKAELENLRKDRMSENEIREYEATQLKQALEDKERDLTYREMQLLAVKTLDEQKLPSSFVDFVIDANQEKTLGRIAQLKKVFTEEISSAVTLRMKEVGREPGRGRVPDGTSEFSGMTPSDIQRKAHEDPEWFRKNEKDILSHYSKGYNK
jgi:exonuclease VII large subunit